MKSRVLIIQGILPHYRIPFFDGLGQLGFDVTVAHSGHKAGVRSASFSEVCLSQSRVGPLIYQRGVTALGREADCVVIPMNPKLGSALVLSRSTAADKQVLWGHGLGRNRGLNEIRLQMARRAAAIVLYDEAEIRSLTRRSIDRSKISVAPNTLFVENAGFDENVLRDQFLFVGRLQSRKRVEDALHAFSALVSKLDPGIRFKIIGAGAHDSILRDCAHFAGVADRVDFLPASTDEDFLKQEFQRSLAYVSPGHVGLGVLHSFAYGIPVITHASADHAPEFHNIVDGQNGLLVGHGSGELAAAMLQLAEHPAYSVALGRNAYDRYARDRRMDQMVDAMGRVLHDTITGSRSGDATLRKAS